MVEIYIGLAMKNKQVILAKVASTEIECLESTKARVPFAPVHVVHFMDHPARVRENLKEWLIFNSVPAKEVDHMIRDICAAIHDVMEGCRDEKR